MGLKGFNEIELLWLKENGYKKVTDSEYVNKQYSAAGVITRILKTDENFIFLDESDGQTAEEEYELFDDLIAQL